MSESIYARFKLCRTALENRVLKAKASAAKHNRPFDEDLFRRTWNDLDGLIVEIMTDPIYMFHHHDNEETVSPLRGPQDEGVFFVVEKRELQGRKCPEIQYVGERLTETFWERTEYTEVWL